MEGEMTTSRKKPRKRMKHLCQQIRQQMEFYFGDANLSKDRFLKQKISEAEDGYLDLALFLKFNKIQALTSDVAVIAKSLSKSALLEVSQDGEKVKRNKKLCVSEDVDERTVYVECLPARADHDWVRRVFSPCGSIQYISIPRFRSTRDIKGFAFVEFSSQAEAQKACKVLHNPPVTVADQTPGKFPKGSKDIQRMQKQLRQQQAGREAGDGKSGRKARKGSGKSGNRDGGTTTLTSVEKSKQGQTADEDVGEKMDSTSELTNGKQTCHDSKTKSDGDDEKESEGGEEMGEDQEGAKVEKSEADGEEAEKVTKPKDIVVESEEKGVIPPCIKKRKLNNKEQETEMKKVRIAVDVDVEPKKKKRKRKKKEKNKNLPKLRVLPKTEWLRLKREYLELQKTSMTQLKASLRELRRDSTTEPDAAEADPAPQESVMAEDKPSKSGRVLTFSEGVIVKLNSEWPMNVKMMKDLLQPHGDVAFVEVTEGDKEGFVRCHSAQGASSISQADIVGLTFSILQGEEEKMHWDKILAAHDATLNRKTKTKRRGKTKLVEKAEQVNLQANTQKHTLFDD